ncbi:hypothetical protein F4778DRAFT_729707, partial [Xylariomycetidae sp. FL2044]
MMVTFFFFFFFFTYLLSFSHFHLQFRRICFFFLNCENGIPIYIVSFLSFFFLLRYLTVCLFVMCEMGFVTL